MSSVGLPARVVDYLSKLKLFTPSAGGAVAKQAFGEEIFGVYRNDIDVPTRGVVVTANGIHIQTISELRYVKYHDIKDIVRVTWDSTALEDPENRHLMIYLHSQERIDLYIAGVGDDGLDLTYMHTFLIGAVQARRSELRKSRQKDQ